MNTTAEGFVKAYETALATQQWENVAPLMHANVGITFSNGSTYKGLAEVEQAYRRNFELIEEEHFTISEVHWVLRNERMAVYQFTFAWTGIINSQQASGGGHGTATLVCEEGQWLLLAEQLGK
ncbi:MAG: nuclear transport factor 2 family protein [Chitinophagales bacterium]